MLATTDIQTRLRDVKTKTAEALQTAEADGGASVVLVAVVREFVTRPTSRWARPRPGTP